LPAVHAEVNSIAPALFLSKFKLLPVIGTDTPLTVAELITTSDVPEFVTFKVILLVLLNATFVTDTCSVCMNPMDIPPIHAATAILRL
jgi:hypothetical protein